MKLSQNISPLKLVGASVCALAVLVSCSLPARAQKPVDRITSAIDSASRVTLVGSHPPRALAANDAGVVPPGTRLQGMTLVFNRSAAQQAALDALIVAQQDPGSPQFHQWLTPAQFGARFGMSDADLATAENWLEQQGFSIDSVSPSRDRIHFSGTAGQASSAFATELHYYRAPGETETHMAPSTDISVPAALASTVLGVGNLSSFRPKSHLVQGVHANFTSSQTGNHFMTPGDVDTIYDITAAYNSGYTGAGQAIAIVGQSAVYTSDIANFLSAAGLSTSKVPTIVLVPGTGTSTVYSGDESESDLDLEYTSALARGASIYFVYTGNTKGYGAFDAMDYAIQTDIAPIISVSYGTCEPALGSSGYNIYNSDLAQAATQGQTVVAAAGDAGSSDCYGEFSGTGSTANNEQLAVDFPASSQYVTALGGTEFPAADVAVAATPSTPTTYWAATSGSDVVSSALSYIPEQVWNDDSAAGGLSSGGGGVSIYSPRPTWQSGSAPGITAIAGNFRLVPDVSLDASNTDAPYAFCTSDSKSWESGQYNSCNSGFRDSVSQDLTLAGGTSFAAPIFASMVAIINQAKGYTAGQGLINPTLYLLSSNTATYAAAFHDITVGGNQCLAGSSYCSGTPVSDYAAGTGYDLASGLGSVDLDKLLTAWPANTTPAVPGFTLSAGSNNAITPGTTATATFTVTPLGGYTGSVAFRIYSTAPIAAACFSIPSVSITGVTPVTATATITTNTANCGSGTIPLVVNATGTAAVASLSHAKPVPAPAPWRAPASATLATLLGLAFLDRRSRRVLLRGGLALGLLLAFSLSGLGLSGCSNTASTPTAAATNTTVTTSPPVPTVTPAGGPYTLTVVGYNPANTNQTATTTLTLTIL